jgi:hypothetical protein
MKRYTLAELNDMPTLHSGHFDNLKDETVDTRVWLSRMTVSDGAPYDDQVTVEKLAAGVWTIVGQYQAH